MEKKPGRSSETPALDELLDQSLRGDETALGLLVTLLHTRYGARIMRFMGKLGTSARTGTIEDAFQDSILSLMERIRSGELNDLGPEQREDFLHYFQNRCDEQLRSTVRARKSPALARKMLPLPAQVLDPRARIPGNPRNTEELDLIRKAFDHFPPEKASILRRYLDGATYDEIALETGEDPDNLMKLISKTKRQLLLAIVRKRQTARPKYTSGGAPAPAPGRRDIENAIATLPREIKEAVGFVHLYHGSVTELALRLGDRGLEKAEARLKQAYRTLSARLKAPFPEAFESASASSRHE